MGFALKFKANEHRYVMGSIRSNIGSLNLFEIQQTKRIGLIPHQIVTFWDHEISHPTFSWTSKLYIG